MSVNIWGPSDLKYLVDAMRSFIPNAAMVHTRSFGPAPSAKGAAVSDMGKFTGPIVLIDDEVVKISAVLLCSSCFEGHQVMSEDSTLLNPSVGLQEKKDQFTKPFLPHPKSPYRKVLPVLKPGDVSVIYVCELPEIRGSLTQQKLWPLD
uniref:Uncharacterized protein n=1 Tax=Nelumbo nucifera TaxID=4432 RepID=A0A822Y747_NELNU|nr:TPA_asm: hypothetical protein HUJ06_028313 [Nelumbo nucifera]